MSVLPDSLPLADADGYGGLIIFAVWLLFGILGAVSKKKKRRPPSQIPTPPGGFEPDDAPPGAPTTDEEPLFVIHDEEPAPPAPAPAPAVHRPPPFPAQRRVRIPRNPSPAPVQPPPPAFTPVPSPAPIAASSPEPEDAPTVAARRGERHILDTSASASGLVLPSLHSMNVPFIPLPLLPLGDTRRAPSANRPDLRSRPSLRRAILAREILRPRNS